MTLVANSRGFQIVGAESERIFFDSVGGAVIKALFYLENFFQPIQNNNSLDLLVIRSMHGAQPAVIQGIFYRLFKKQLDGAPPYAETQARLLKKWGECIEPITRSQTYETIQRARDRLLDLVGRMLVEELPFSTFGGVMKPIRIISSNFCLTAADAARWDCPIEHTSYPADCQLYSWWQLSERRARHDLFPSSGFPIQYHADIGKRLENWDYGRVDIQLDLVRQGDILLYGHELDLGIVAHYAIATSRGRCISKLGDSPFILEAPIPCALKMYGDYVVPFRHRYGTPFFGAVHRQIQLLTQSVATFGNDATRAPLSLLGSKWRLIRQIHTLFRAQLSIAPDHGPFSTQYYEKSWTLLRDELRAISAIFCRDKAQLMRQAENALRAMCFWHHIQDEQMPAGHTFRLI